MVKLTMEPVTRIEGHAKITVQLDDAGNVQDTRLHVMEFRGFEKFMQGRPVEEAPRIVPRICGICDVQHHLAAAKAADQCYGFEDNDILPAAYKMRELMNWGSFMHSHALHFYFLAAPDLVIPDGNRKTRNVFQIIKDMPDVALQAIQMRKNGLDIVKAVGGRPIHPTSSTPGGISTELDAETQKDLLGKAQQNVELAQATLDLAIPIFEEKIDLVDSLGNFGDTRHCGLTNGGVWDVYNGDVRIKSKDGSKVEYEYNNLEYLDVVAEHVKPYSWLKFPYIKELGYPDGIYRVAPLSRINVADKMPDAAPLAQDRFKEFHDKFGYAQAPLLFHWARLIELLASAESAANHLEGDLSAQKFPDAIERVAGEGAGIVEAPRGTLIHHYKTDDDGLMTNVNIVVATIQNNPAMEMGIQKVAKDYIKPGVEVDDSIFNLMEMVIRAYDPCLSCATHSMDSQMRLATIEVYDSEGNLINKI
ncbi:F420-non-reducing hydrogenase, subunit A [Methanobrevibacter arboriphilus JCM 13429 = DSM 1125]|uniref:F420-non-reducing hydrogenase, subunit A n=1 Tax=Methanobrevibacter arboriphilus JCM 13429 = DSM 1125 TaxID=1300164 RepID=A0A1V6N022_METAZ|nr:Ni/Fe hydrogenase subunit alpha [Methanobrevibacter arboriphilus]OQD58041.1 F420-non-reducing hydrogenase, subunit A [Methanobrevibacter arboriphilus JCM 13429 = DSM 1125]